MIYFSFVNALLITFSTKSGLFIDLKGDLNTINGTISGPSISATSSISALLSEIKAAQKIRTKKGLWLKNKSYTLCRLAKHFISCANHVISQDEQNTNPTKWLSPSNISYSSGSVFSKISLINYKQGMCDLSKGKLRISLKILFAAVSANLCAKSILDPIVSKKTDTISWKPYR